MCGLDSSVLGYGLVTESCKHSDETSGSIKGMDLFMQLSDYQLLKDDFSTEYQV
jgi:hypothetical protein